jgi:hypothetical protein
MAGMIMLSMLMSASFAFLTFIATARQEQSATLVLRAQDNTLDLDEDFTLRAVNQSNTAGVTVTNGGGVPLQIIHVVIYNGRDTRIVGFGQGLDAGAITVDGGESVTILTSFSTPVPGVEYSIKVLSKRGMVRTVDYPPPPPAPPLPDIPLRQHAGNLSYDILTIQWTAKVGNAWPAVKIWHTEDAIPMGSSVVWKVNITNNNNFDLWLDQGSVFVMRGPSTKAQFYVINPAFETATSIFAFDENNANHAKIASGTWKWVYFGTKNAGSSQEPDQFSGSASQYGTFFAFFGNWDENGDGLADATKYYGQTLPYKGIRTF